MLAFFSKTSLKKIHEKNVLLHNLAYLSAPWSVLSAPCSVLSAPCSAILFPWAGGLWLLDHTVKRAYPVTEDENGMLKAAEESFSDYRMFA